MSAFFRFYPINQAILEKTIEYTIQHCIYARPDEKTGQFSPETMGIRRDGFATFIKLTKYVSLEVHFFLFSFYL